MRIRIWLSVLMISMLLACEKGEKPKQQRAAATPQTTTTPYTLEMSFEGLVGYVNVADAVWALLPKADPAVALPVGARRDSEFYPPHYAVLKVSGKNIKGFGLPVNLQIPIDGFDLELPQNLFGSGTGLDPADFRQDIRDAAVDKLAPGVLNPTPTVRLAARIKLPQTDLKAYQGSELFTRVAPEPPDDQSICDEPSQVDGTLTRVESVKWSPRLSEDLKLVLRSFGGGESTILLTPAANETIVRVKIVNQVAEALYDECNKGHHWPAYRWYYDLSGVKTCKDHYYPQGPAGGNRCPQKLYSE